MNETSGLTQIPSLCIQVYEVLSCKDYHDEDTPKDMWQGFQQRKMEKRGAVQ
jgi:hypothetical protein